MLRDLTKMDVGHRLRTWCQPPSGGLLGDQWTKAAIALVLIGSIAIVFWHQISGSAVFIGESDRLNSYLNMRLAEYDALKLYGRVPDWNSGMFGGSSMAALHWMNLGTDPLTYLLQLLPRSDVFQALGYVSAALVLMSCVTAYLYIRDVTGADGPSLLGGLGYGLSVFSLHRAAQVDNAELTLVLIPLGLLALRRARLDNLIRPMVGLTLVMGALAFWGLLQEVAYAFIFFGFYSLYRAAVLGWQGREKALAPVAVMTMASVVALLFAAPRLISIHEELSTLVRTSTLHYYDYSQVLRFFHEGVHGRYFEEGRLLGHGMNLHEGLQLVSSTTLALFVCLGIARPQTPIETLGTIGFFALLSAMLPTFDPFYDVTRRVLPISLPFYKVITFGLFYLVAVFALVRCEPYLRLGGALRRLTPSAPRPADTTFHLFALTAILFAILVAEGAGAVYRLFGRADFTHMRLSVLALLPLCTLFAVYLAELKGLPIYRGIKKGLLENRIAILAVVLAGSVAYLIQDPWLDHVIVGKLYLLDHNELMPAVVLRVCLAALLLGVLAIALVSKEPKAFDLRPVASLAIGTVVLVEILTYAHLKVAGPQTWTYPVPFRMFNYLNVDPSVLRPPGEDKLAAFRQLFDVERYRMVAVSDDPRYPGAKIPHIAAFWKARTIGGYGTGVSQRMAMLPWPKDVQTLRTIDFNSLRNIDSSIFPLLALLNVKYLLALTPDVYFNVASPGRSGEHEEKEPSLTIGSITFSLKVTDIGGIAFRILENPVNPLPRHFLVEQVIGTALPPAVLSPAVATSKAARILIFEGQVDDLTRTSFVERYAIGTKKKFDASGDLSVSYQGDMIDVRVTPSTRERFLVINETYHPRWRVYVGSERIETIPTNLVMNGVVIPAGLDRIQLRFEPFSSRPWAPMMMFAAFAGFVACVFLLLKFQARQVPAR